MDISKDRPNEELWYEELLWCKELPHVWMSYLEELYLMSNEDGPAVRVVQCVNANQPKHTLPTIFKGNHNEWAILLIFRAVIVPEVDVTMVTDARHMDRFSTVYWCKTRTYNKESIAVCHGNSLIAQIQNQPFQMCNQLSLIIIHF